MKFHWKHAEKKTTIRRKDNREHRKRNSEKGSGGSLKGKIHIFRKSPSALGNVIKRRGSEKGGKRRDTEKAEGGGRGRKNKDAGPTSCCTCINQKPGPAFDRRGQDGKKSMG